MAKRPVTARHCRKEQVFCGWMSILAGQDRFFKPERVSSRFYAYGGVNVRSYKVRIDPETINSYIKIKWPDDINQ
ncbi:MAG: hypothetical protein NTZ22_13380 [Hyphomicrobiales bacterium]|nr:hypothetical protein [Hyphomicrobiales bacterium]